MEDKIVKENKRYEVCMVFYRARQKESVSATVKEDYSFPFTETEVTVDYDRTSSV